MNKTRLFRKKPVVIEAIQLLAGEKSQVEIQAFTGGIARPGIGGMTIPTLEGDHQANVGDWIIKGVKGEFYPCKPDIFAATYECAEETIKIPCAYSHAMAFGGAIEAMKQGERVARAGWNGKGMWLCLGLGSKMLEADKFWSPHTRRFAEDNGGSAEVLPYIIMKTADGKVLMGWLASQTDMLAEDWMILNAQEHA